MTISRDNARDALYAIISFQHARIDAASSTPDYDAAEAMAVADMAVYADGQEAQKSRADEAMLIFDSIASRATSARRRQIDGATRQHSLSPQRYRARRGLHAT